jgi:SEC-C motif
MNDERPSLHSEIIVCEPHTFESVRPLLSKALHEALTRLAERGVPAQLFGEQGSTDRCGLEAGISEAEAIRTEIGPGSTEHDFSLSHFLIRTPLSRGFQLESREAYEQARQSRRDASLAAYAKQVEAHPEAIKEYDIRLKKHGREVERRRAFVTAQAHALRSLGVVLVVAGLAGSCAIFYFWNLDDYYKGVLSTWMGLRIIKAFAVALPWLVILLPAGIGGVACSRLFTAAWHFRRRKERERLPYPRAPREPSRPEKEKDGPFDVLDSVDLVKSYCMKVVSEAVLARLTNGNRPTAVHVPPSSALAAHVEASALDSDKSEPAPGARVSFRWIDGDMYEGRIVSLTASDAVVMLESGRTTTVELSALEVRASAMTKGAAPLPQNFPPPTRPAATPRRAWRPADPATPRRELGLESSVLAAKEPHQMTNKSALCPCGSGKPFAVCHGVDDA